MLTMHLLLLLLLVMMLLLLLMVVVEGHLLPLHCLGPLLLPTLGRLLGVVHVVGLLVSGLLLLLRFWAVASQVAYFLADPAASVVGDSALGEEASVEQVLLGKITGISIKNTVVQKQGFFVTFFFCSWLILETFFNTNLRV